MRIVLLAFLLSIGNFVQGQGYSDSLRVSLITGSSGDDLYAIFGHSAVRVQDFKYNKDYLFNYGTFDFDTPGFYWKFLRGKLNYVLSVGDTRQLAAYYDRSGRGLVEQELYLDEAQKQRVVEFLYNNYKPENRGYLYDFFYDNCATRIRDILETELDTRYLGDTTSTRTFRQLLDIYLVKQPWTDFGIDLLLGLPADKQASIRNEMFLPELMAANLQEYLRYESGTAVLGEAKQFNNTPMPPIMPKKTIWKPTNIFLALFLLSILLTFLVSDKWKKAFDTILFLVMGIAGVLLVFMWFGTDHSATQQNLNILWLNPLYLFLLFVLGRKESPLRKQLLWGLLIINMLVLGFWNAIPQQFHIADIGIILAASLRCLDRLNLVNFKQRFQEMKTA